MENDSAKPPRSAPPEAEQVYLLMKDNVRISRNSRASWYFKHLNSTIKPKAKTVAQETESSDKDEDGEEEGSQEKAENVEEKKKEEEEFEILTVIPRTAKHSLPTGQADDCQEYKVTADSNIIFLAKKYNLVFVLDISPSAAAPDLQCKTILLEQIFESLCCVIKGVAKPIRLPGYAEIFQPQLYITVVACSPLISRSASKVLIQGHAVNAENVQSLLDTLKAKLCEYEVGAAESMAGVLPGFCDDAMECDLERMTGGIFEDIIERPEYPDRMDYMMTADIAFVNMIRYGMLGLQLLPENSASGIVVITDGVVGVPEASVFESLMAQLRHNTISCSFIPVSSQFSVGLRLGQVPYTHLLQFIATATLGAYFSKTPDVESLVDVGWNVYHRGLLSWSFQVSIGGQKVDSLSSLVWQELDEDLAWSSRSIKSSDTTMWLTPLMKKKHTERTLQISLAHLISCRLREGYIIKDVQIKKGETEITVVMVLPWRDNVWIYYEAHSNWPLSQMKRHTRVDITVEASYEFLHDVTCPLKKPFKSPYRTSLVKKYWQTLQVMSETDMMLGHLQSFASNSTYYRVPDSVMNGVPLFYLPANSSNPQLSLQHSSKDTSLNQFATFWKAVLHLDGNAWQKWLHTQRLSVILAHDIQLGKHLHIPNSSDRYHTITCRQSLTNLHFCLISWTTFVLLENHSYIKLLFDDPDKPPISFFVLRLTLKPPCMVMRLAFLGGTPGHLRRKTLEELVGEINKLTFPQRGPQKDDKTTTRRHPSGNREPVHIPPLQRQLSERLCCIISRKPTEMILVRYERAPGDFIRDLPGIPNYSSYGKTGSANTSGSSVQFMLSQYLYHQRWVWSIQHGMSLPIPMQAVGRILSSLTKIRLQEGFMFAHAASGIINMVLEIDMKISDCKTVDDSIDCAEDPPEGPGHQPKPQPPSEEAAKPCVLQYVLFPPHTTTNKHESESEEDVDDRQDTAEADGELQIITEVWVEPECGKVINSTPERKHFEGLNFKELAQAMFPTDLECISTMVTFEHLQLMCQSLSSSFNTVHDLHNQKVSWSFENLQGNTGLGSSVHTVPFTLDIMRLLPKCQQVELLFSTYIQDVYKLRLPFKFIPNPAAEGEKAENSEDKCPNDRLFDLFLESMKDQHDLELHLSDSDCERVLRLVRERERDAQEHPLPFVLEDDTLEGFEGSCNRSESTISVAASVASTHVSGGASLGSNKPVHTQPTLKRALTNQMQRRLSIGSGLPRERNEDSLCLDESRNLNVLRKHDVESLPKMLPRWRCFVKHVCANHIILCFIPATYDDLRFLVQGRAVLRMAEIFQMMVNETKNKEVPAEQANANDATDAPGEENVVRVMCSGKTHGETAESAAKGESAPTSSVNIKVSAPETVLEKTQGLMNLNTKGQASDIEVSETASLPTLSSVAESDLVTSTPKQSPQKTASSEGAIEVDDDSKTDTQCETLEEETVQHDAEDQFNMPSSYKSFQIPVYVYNCPLSSLTDQLINKWTYVKPPDLFQDMNIIGDEQADLSTASSKEDVTAAESQDETDHPMPRRRQDSESLRERLTTMKEELTSESSNGEQDSLKEHCTLISEYYLRSFVIGIFQSLLHNQDVTDKDIDAAINAICEESLPQEIDLTRYLQNVCGHVRKVIKKATLEQVLKEDLMKTLPKPVDSALSPQSQDSGDTSKGHDSDNDDEANKSNLPHLGSVKVPLTLLQCDSHCESMPNLHKIIKNKFTAILQQYFHPVQANPDYKGYFFYCPPSYWRLREYSEVEKSDAIDFENSADAKMATSGDESDIFQSDIEGQEEEHGKKSEQDSITSNKDSASLDSLSARDMDLDEDIDDDEEFDNVPPLFIYLTCSVRTCLGNTLHSVAVTDLPTCFGELKSCLKDLPEEVDLQDIDVTLDMICLTLPPEVDEEMPQKRPCFNRLTSYTSQVSVDSDNMPSPDDREDSFSYAATMDTGYLKQYSADIKKLPIGQRTAIEYCQKQIQWLLQDEIASALRLMLPVAPDTLDMVANHVHNSVDRPNCIMEEVPLQFVFGPEQSLTHFIEDFERMDLPCYHLQKEGKYYFLSLNRVHVHAEALRCAMENLKGEPSPVSNVKPSPGKPDMDASVEVLSKSGTHDDNVETFNPEDIKISVIRPSPVKEINPLCTEEQAGKKVADEQGDDSSDSSIQVLDPTQAEEPIPASLMRSGEFKLTPLLPAQSSVTTTVTVVAVAPEEKKETKATEEKKGSSNDGSKKPEEGKLSRTPSMRGEEEKAKKKDDPEKSHSDTTERRLRRFKHKSGDSPLTRSFESDHKPYVDHVTRSRSEESPDAQSQSNVHRQLSPLTVAGVDSKNTSIRRVHSSASFEKYKQGHSVPGASSSKSGGTTPIGRPSDVQTPTRSHHPSGLHTPVSSSMYYPSSRSSVGEEGYEGDSSDLDEDGAMMSFSDRGNTRLHMPNFWLIMQVTQDKVQVFFHARDSYEEESGESIHQKNLYNNVIDNINDICKTVNQRLLLRDLNQTRMCNKLLVCEADEDVRWAKDKYHSFRSRKTEDSDDSDTDAPQDRYLHAALKLMPGHFACDKVCTIPFVLHPRLKTGHSRIASRGVQALLTVLNKFSVNNRKNLFVIKDTSENVFYLRLEEGEKGDFKTDFQSGGQKDDEHSLAASRSSSLLSLPTKRVIEMDEDGAYQNTRHYSIGEKTGDDASKTKGEILYLTVHGITPASVEITQDLSQLLKKKLDDVVLDILTVMLARNPMCKLTPEDVEFIQLVNKPNEVVRLTIPSAAMLQQYALGYYLRQNLLQFLSTPKYADTRQATVFRDYSQPSAPIIQDNVVFLYNRPQQAGGKGIACLQMQFVDGRGNAIQLLSGPKPSPHSYKDPLDRNDFEKLVKTSIYQVTEGQKKPDHESDASGSTDDQLCNGPTALVQFNIWERGDVDMYQLRELLVKAMKHAACDVIMEYQVLTAPLCEVPMQPLSHISESPAVSAAASPKVDGSSMNDGSRAGSHEPLKRMPSDKATPKDKSATFNILTDVFKSKNRDSPRDSPASPVPSEVDEMKRKEHEVEQQRVLKYEQGDRGTLNPVFTDVLPAWLEFANSLDVPSVQRSHFSLVSRTAVDYVLKEFQSTVNKLVSDINPKVFRFVEGVAGATNAVYIPYSPSRAPMSAQDTKLESSMDFASHAPCALPGRSCCFVSVGRNVNQWKASIRYSEDEMTSDITSQNNPKTHKRHQRFPPYDPTIYTVDKGEGGLSVPPTPTVAYGDPLSASGLSPKEAPFSAKSGPDFSGATDPLAALAAAVKVFVPRQRFILLTVQDKEFCLFTYNWPSEHNSHLEKHMIKLIQWHNARDHLLSCILAQKMGLFQHVLFGDVPADSQTSQTSEGNPFVQNVSENDSLIRYTSPIGPTLQTGPTRSRQPSSAITPPVLFEDLYRDTQPSVAMHKATYGNLRDPLHKHGAQMMELRSRLRKEAERNHKLSGLYMMWQQRMGSTPISEDVLELLKSSSRLVHSVSTPLLFSPLWRRRVVPKPTVADFPPPPPPEPKQARSRHSSGASIRSKRSDSMDGKIRIGVDSPEPSGRQVAYEEGWHMDLRHSFMNQYVQYLQSLLFVQINTRPATPRRTTSRQRSGEKTTREDSHSAPVIHKDFIYLQKTFPGGIILLELGFKDMYFCVNVYAFECSRLPVGKTVNPQLAVIFTEELDKFKDLTHVHSFAHDFHLRVVQTYVGNKQQMVFKHGYHLTNFLHDFIVVFPYVPSFSRNFIYEASIQIDHTNSPGSQLFDYMLNHDKQYGMRAIRMIPCDDDIDQDHEYALVKQFHCDEELCEVEFQRARPQDYEVGLVLTHQPGPRYSDTERHTLRLKFFIVLTSKMEIFPRDKLEKKLWAFKSGSLRRYTARSITRIAGFASNISMALGDESLSCEGLSQQLGIGEEEMGSWNETINYLGYSNKHQAVGYILLRRLAEIAKSKVQHMVENAMQQCRRDCLWRRMLLPPTTEDEGRRKRRSERQPDSDDNFLTLLTFVEFEELLDIVSKEQLERLDPRLAMLQNMSFTWYQGLVRVLINKYQDNHRLFVNAEGRVQHLVVLNPNHLDAFMMLTIENSTASLKAAYRQTMPELNHTPDNPNLPALAMQNHIEGFVNACCYHMWSVLA